MIELFFDRELPSGRPRAVLALGVFDGVHLGHRRILGHLTSMAERTGALPCAVTFDPHPRSVVQSGAEIPLLVPLEKRIALLHEAGAQSVGVISFTRDFAATEPELFLEELAARQDFSLAGICVGSRWRFGAQGRGNCSLLQGWCAAHQVAFDACPELESAGEPVSSTRIRQLLGAGKLGEAEELLGRPYLLEGVVEHGFQDAASELQAPTANILLYGKLPVPDGVYAARVLVDAVQWAGAVNIGFSPTFHRSDPQRRLEVHLLDYQGNLYGKTLQIRLLRRLRSEISFPSVELLKKQIALDVTSIRRWFAKEK